MAYSIMAGLPAVYGLYVSFFPVLIYAFLGTSRHLSIGSFAITSLMTFSCIQKLEGKYYPIQMETNSSASLNVTTTTSTTHMHLNPLYLSSNPDITQNIIESKVLISMSVTFMAGIIQVCVVFIHSTSLFFSNN
jgi:MFS superfamily sulfate permease-like transporter